MADEPERSESGAPILRHQPRERQLEPAIGDGANIEKISAHIERPVGPVASVFHEILSDLVHVDIHLVAPANNRNFYTLVTSGMSDRPMTPPEECGEVRFAEIVCCLPPDWPLAQEDL